MILYKMATHLHDLSKCIVMKKIIFSTLFFLCMAGLASAQSDSRNTNTKSVSQTTKRSARHRSRTVSTSEKANATETVSARTNSKTVIPDNRTEYMQDGQLATYTGHQAAPSNSDEFQSKKGKKKKKNADRTRD